MYRNAAANSGSGAFAKVTFDTELFDTNNNFATGTYTVPVTGFYHLDWVINIVVSTTDVVAALYKNGAAIHWGIELFDTSTGGGGSGGSALISAAANDTLEIYAFSNAGAALTVGVTKNHFTGYLVSQT